MLILLKIGMQCVRGMRKSILLRGMWISEFPSCQKKTKKNVPNFIGFLALGPSLNNVDSFLNILTTLCGPLDVLANPFHVHNPHSLWMPPLCKLPFASVGGLLQRDKTTNETNEISHLVFKKLSIASQFIFARI